MDHLDWFRFTPARLRGESGTPFVVSRTGYTGELGYEVLCHPKDCAEIFDAIWKMELGELREFVSEEVNKTYTNLELDYTFNDENDPNRFYYRSDHYNFAKNNIPVIFYFNGTHNDYHQPSDTPDKIDYNLLETRTKLIFATAWQLANQDRRITKNKDNEFLK